MDVIRIRFIEQPDGVESDFKRAVEELLYAARPRFSSSRQQWRPQVDICETADEIVVTAELAGVPREEIQLEVGPRIVRLSGTRAPRSRIGAGRYRLAEIPYGRFERALELSVPVDPGSTTAVCRDGLLEIRLRKRPLDRIQKIHVERS